MWKEVQLFFTDMSSDVLFSVVRTLPQCSLLSPLSKTLTGFPALQLIPSNQHSFKIHSHVIIPHSEMLDVFKILIPRCFSLILQAFSTLNLLSEAKKAWLVLAFVLIHLIVFILSYPSFIYSVQIRNKDMFNSIVISLCLIRVNELLNNL